MFLKEKNTFQDLKIFKKQTKGDKLINSILKDIENSPQDYQKLSGGAFHYIGEKQWWGYIQMSPGRLTIRRKDSKTKDKNLHYKVNDLSNEKFTEFYEAY